MGGGVFNLVAIGDPDAIIIGNPDKSFFKSVYAKYTPFGLQKFKVDFDGAKGLRLHDESTFSFKVPRYADLLLDTYLSVDLPNIWSPIFPPTVSSDNPEPVSNTVSNVWVPYEFRWIDHLGAKMIKKITISCGNLVQQEYSGDYILAAAQRDLPSHKLSLFYNMIGHVPEMQNPIRSNPLVYGYPNAPYLDPADYPAGPEPSIAARTVLVPLGPWFSQRSQQAFPLCASTKSELTITVVLRPIYELFRIRDVLDSVNNYPYVAPNGNVWYMQFHRFLTPPPDLELTAESYTDTRTQWDTRIHLNCTYCFLSGEERNEFAKGEKKYLIKQVSEKRYYDLVGSAKVELESNGLVAGWLWYLQRSDVGVRNEWSNCTNWPYEQKPIPHHVVSPQAPDNAQLRIFRTNDSGQMVSTYIGQGVNADGTLTSLTVTPAWDPDNVETILTSVGVLFNGVYRENVQPVSVYNYIEKYQRTTGYAPNGLYCYHFGVTSNNDSLHPSGAVNMDAYPRVELEMTTIVPKRNNYAQTMVICDPDTLNVVGINKPTWQIYEYNYVLVVFEERYNVITFSGGMCGAMFA